MVNQELLEQIKNLKEREPKNQGNQYDIVNSNYKEELLHLKKVNQDMLILLIFLSNIEILSLRRMGPPGLGPW